MGYWIIKHDTLDKYLSDVWDMPERHWADFDVQHVKRFATKEAALLVSSTLFPECLVIQVIEANIAAVVQAAVEGMRTQILEDIRVMNARLLHQLQHHQGR